MRSKIVWGSIAVVIAVGVVIAALVVTQAGGVVADAIETYGSAATHTDVNVGAVDVALTEGRASVDALTVGNPEGYSTDYAVRIDDTAVTLDLSSLSGDVPLVTEMLLTGAHINAEQRGDATNLTDIQRLMSGTDESAAAESPGRIVIERFRLQDARVTVTSELLVEPEELVLDDVVVEGIGRGGGATYSEAAEAILTPILGAARDAVQDRLGRAAGEAVGGELREKLEEEGGERLRELLER